MKNNPPNTGKKNPTPEGKKKKLTDKDTKRTDNVKEVDSMKEVTKVTVWLKKGVKYNDADNIRREVSNLLQDNDLVDAVDLI